VWWGQERKRRGEEVGGDQGPIEKDTPHSDRGRCAGVAGGQEVVSGGGAVPMQRGVGAYLAGIPMQSPMRKCKPRIRCEGRVTKSLEKKNVSTVIKGKISLSRVSCVNVSTFDPVWTTPTVDFFVSLFDFLSRSGYMTASPPLASGKFRFLRILY
jgi:hypothetical protein